MSAQARVGKLEALLERVQRNRHRVIGGDAASGAASPAAVSPAASPAAVSSAVGRAPALEPELRLVPTPAHTPAQAPVDGSPDPDFDLRMTPVPEAPTAREEDPLELDLTDDRGRAPAPTPMEKALEFELEAPRSEPEITVDEGPEVTFEEEDEGDAIAIGGGLPSDLVPTAPVGTRAPEPEPPRPRPLQPLRPQPLALPPASPSAPVARVVNRPEPVSDPTFGELLSRTLALRPR